MISSDEYIDSYQNGGKEWPVGAEYFMHYSLKMVGRKIGLCKTFFNSSKELRDWYSDSCKSMSFSHGTEIKVRYLWRKTKTKPEQVLGADTLKHLAHIH